MLGNHFFGLYEKALPPDLDWRQRLYAAGELGFDFVEISIDESDARLARLDWDVNARSAMRRAISETGITISSMSLDAHRRFSYGSADPIIRQQAHEITKKAIILCRDLGIRVIRLAGYDTYYEPSTPQSQLFFEDGLRSACELAAKHQVMLAMDIMDTRLISSVCRYKQYKKRLDSPWFTLYPDLGNLSVWSNDVPAELALGINEIVGIHLKDTSAISPDSPDNFKCVPFGDGCVDFQNSLAFLETLNYCGPYTLDMWYEDGQDYTAEIQKAKAFIENAFFGKSADSDTDSDTI